jgi:methylphosphotriester-DNA--protein-cysteine methyltransferase
MISDNVIEKKDLLILIHSRKILLAGNRRLKIYGKLNCASGKRMKRENRVFFTNEKEAIQEGFRPCKKCMTNNAQEVG